MALPFRTILNRVLMPLGQPTIADGVTTIAQDYDKLVASFVNIIKEEIEGAHNWRSLQQTLPVTMLAGAITANIAGTNERSRLVRLHQAESSALVPLVFDTTDVNEPFRLEEIDLQEWVVRSEQEADATAQVAEPNFFALGVNSTTGQVQLNVWPPPVGQRTYNVRLVVPQDYLENNQLSTNVLLPARPLIMGALWYAMADRGEELGASSPFSEDRYRKALDDEIARDSAEQGDLYELVAV